MGDVEEVELVADFSDVAVDGVHLGVGVGEELFGGGGEGGEVGVGVGVDEEVWAVVEAGGEVDHECILDGVEDGFGGPGAADVAEVGEEIVDEDLVGGPVEEVEGFHEDEVAVVAPVVEVSGAFPLGGAEAFALGEDVEVGEGHVEGAVGAAHDVGVADAFLDGEVFAEEDGVGVVDVGEGVGVGGGGEVEGVGFVFEVDEEVIGGFGVGGGFGFGGGELFDDLEEFWFWGLFIVHC